MDGLIAGLLAAIGYYAVNLGGVSLMLSLIARRSFIAVIRESEWSLPIDLCLALTGAFVGTSHAQLGMIGTAMFVVPLGILRFTLMIFARKSRQTITTLETLNEQLSGEIDQRSVAEAALGESEGHLRAVLDNVAEGILTADDDGLIQTCNPAGERVFGFQPAAVIGLRMGELVPILNNVSRAAHGGFGRVMSQNKLGAGPVEITGR